MDGFRDSQSREFIGKFRNRAAVMLDSRPNIQLTPTPQRCQLGWEISGKKLVDQIDSNNRDLMYGRVADPKSLAITGAYDRIRIRGPTMQVVQQDGGQVAAFGNVDDAQRARIDPSMVKLSDR